MRRAISGLLSGRRRWGSPRRRRTRRTRPARPAPTAEAADGPGAEDALRAARHGEARPRGGAGGEPASRAGVRAGQGGPGAPARRGAGHARSARRRSVSSSRAPYNENESAIGEKEALLTEHLGQLGELFGVVRQVATDTSGQVWDSLTSSQLGPRKELLDRLGRSKELPSTDDLEKLWYELQREMTRAGPGRALPGAGADHRGPDRGARRRFARAPSAPSRAAATCCGSPRRRSCAS